MKRILLIGLTLVVAVGIAVPVALAGGGNSDAAKACQKDGWQGLVRLDGTGFKNTGDCVSYAAQGGVLKAKPAAVSVPAAKGDVGFAIPLGDRLLTGNVQFDAQGTTDMATGQLTMTNSWGYSLTGAVTCFNRINANTAVFSGTITAATLYATPGYFIAKVIDNGSSGDKIVVFVNEHGTANCSDPANDGLPGGNLLADVTSGNLVVQ